MSNLKSLIVASRPTAGSLKLSSTLGARRCLALAAALSMIACGGGYAARPSGTMVAAATTQNQPRVARKTQTIADRLPEVRLRKMHLVRPDLIFFPISYEVVC